MTCSILNFDRVNLVFAALSRIFRGHETGLLHASELSFPVVHASVGVPDRI